MSKHKGGLQKKVSSIFDGVPLESDSVRGGVHRPAEAPTESAPLPASKAPAPPKPAVEPPVARPPVAPPPSAWPKAPPVTPEPAQPKFTAPPRSSLASTLASEMSVPAPSRSMSPTRSETARAPQPAPAKSAAPRVVVKQTGPASDRKRNILLVGGLSAVFAIVVLWQTGIFSTIVASPAPEPLGPGNIQRGELAQINWQRPSLPLPKRDPMVYGGYTSTTETGISSSPISLYGITKVGNRMAALTRDPKRPTLNIGDSYEWNGYQIKIVDITMQHVEYEIDGKLQRVKPGEQ